MYDKHNCISLYFYIVFIMSNNPFNMEEIKLIVVKPSDERMCRICFSYKNINDLIVPCNCSGTNKYVHRNCLNVWRSSNINPNAYDGCEICKKKYVYMTEYNNESRHNMAIRIYKFKAISSIAFMFLLLQIIIFIFSFVISNVDKLNDFFSSWFVFYKNIMNEKIFYYFAGVITLFFMTGIFGICEIVISLSSDRNHSIDYLFNSYSSAPRYNAISRCFGFNNDVTIIPIHTTNNNCDCSNLCNCSCNDCNCNCSGGSSDEGGIIVLIIFIIIVIFGIFIGFIAFIKFVDYIMNKYFEKIKKLSLTQVYVVKNLELN